MRIAIALAALLLPSPAASQDYDYAAQQDTFQLFTRCSKLDVFVVGKDSENEIPALTEVSVQRAVWSRLSRSATL